MDDKDADIIDVHKARQYAFKLLSYRGRSEKELEERLRKKGFPETVIASTINTLRHIGFINDRSLAESLVREAMEVKLLGSHGARRFMLSRGIPLNIIDTMLITDDKEDIKNAKKLLNKKLSNLGNCPPEKIQKKLYNLLLRKGYSFETIKTVLRYKKLDEED